MASRTASRGRRGPRFDVARTIWILSEAAGLALVALCSLAMVWLTGAARFAGWRRGVAVGLGLGGPAAVTIAMFAAAF